MHDRTIIKIGGKDNQEFLQNLVTNNICDTKGDLIYAALLSPQGKFQFDFFIFKNNQNYMLDVATDKAEALNSRLSIYKLRADVKIETSDLKVSLGIDKKPDQAFLDPRDKGLGWRLYSKKKIHNAIDWDNLRINLVIPETDKELLQDSYILEMGFERLRGVDFKKGCYVGQEVTARMKHKTKLRKGLARIRVSKEVDLHTPVFDGNKKIGFVGTQSGDKALAYIRYESLNEKLTAADAIVSDIEIFD